MAAAAFAERDRVRIKYLRNTATYVAGRTRAEIANELEAF